MKMFIKITVLFLLLVTLAGTEDTFNKNLLMQQTNKNRVEIIRKTSMPPDFFLQSMKQNGEKKTLLLNQSFHLSYINSKKEEIKTSLAKICAKVQQAKNQEQRDSLKELGNFKITFYCGGSCCNGKWAGQTCTGNPLIEGRTIAVDKKVIPLGTEVYIKGFGWYVAEDVGGGIKGNHIDIYLEDHDRVDEMGVQSAEVYIKY